MNLGHISKWCIKIFSFRLALSFANCLCACYWCLGFTLLLLHSPAYSQSVTRMSQKLYGYKSVVSLYELFSLKSISFTISERFSFQTVLINKQTVWINTFFKNRISQFLPFDLQEQTLSVRTKHKYQKLAKISKK